MYFTGLRIRIGSRSGGASRLLSAKQCSPTAGAGVQNPPAKGRGRAALLEGRAEQKCSHFIVTVKKFVS